MRYEYVFGLAAHEVSARYDDTSAWQMRPITHHGGARDRGDVATAANTETDGCLRLRYATSQHTVTVAGM